MTNEVYQDPIIKKYSDLVVAANSNLFKKIYQGDPFKIPKTNLPCLIISKTTTQTRPFTNVEDEYAIGMRMTVVTDVRDTLSTNDNAHDLTEAIAKLYDIVEGRNSSDLTLKDDSLLNILRNNQEVDTANNLRTDLDTITSVDWGDSLLRDRDVQYSLEARIDFVAHYIQVR